MLIVRLAIIFDAKTRQMILRYVYHGKKESTVCMFIANYNNVQTIYSGYRVAYIKVAFVQLSSYLSFFQNNIIAHCGYGDWLMLTRLLNNLPHILRPPFIEILDKELQGKMS